MDAIDTFREETRAWLAENCPPAMRQPKKGETPPTWGTPEWAEQAAQWRERFIARGWSAPTWPAKYGGGGLSKAEDRVLQQEMAALGTRSPVWSFGLTMLGPVLLEFGNDEQCAEHLPPIVRDEITWCQGYSEPGAGSDLASLQTRAVRDGDEYVINGQKIWTTGATRADWMFCLVRTDPNSPKHDGISFILFSLKQPGVEIQPIQLISGSSDFCQVFFQDVRAKASNLVGVENGGWTIAKRLLQHERSMLSSMGGGPGGRGRAKSRTRQENPMAVAAAKYVGMSDGRIADPLLRDRIAQHELDQVSFGLTMRRSAEEAKASTGPSHLASMSKYYASEMNKRAQELLVSIMGARGLGWEEPGFEPGELLQTRGWLRSRGNSIEGGTSEVQLNVIAKRELGLPD